MNMQTDPETKTEHSNKPVPSVITTEMIEKFDVAGPRYTSYPTADRFVEAFSATEYKQALNQRKVGGLTLPLSMYVHLPFCDTLCFYCACNKIVTKRHERASEYLEYLKKEIDLHLPLLDKRPTISQLHFGGGTPTFFSDLELSSLLGYLSQHFDFPESGEYSIEVDPRTVDSIRLQSLKEMGFNRISFGVQDLDDDVQAAVNRVQFTEQISALVKTSRDYQFKSVNIDLIYGLPKQTSKTFDRTLDQVIALRPDRIALYAYAHLPERFKPQRRILAQDLPTSHEKIIIMANAIQRLLDAGYVYIGMDHFALPTDELAIAKRQGRLHRNFQGYSTQPDCDLISLGVSAIGRIGVNYSQNTKSLEDYYDALDQGRFPIVRGITLSHDDLLRRAVIMGIMCQGGIDFETIELSYLIDFKKYFSKELSTLIQQDYQGIVRVHTNGVQVTDVGWFFVRAVAMVFDKALQYNLNRTKFSKII